MSAAFSLAKSNTFIHLSVKDGLSNNSVNCILQDREGYIWFGTNEGLSKYDGYKFTVLQADLNDKNRSLQNNVISGMCEDRKDRLWAVTEGGGLHEINKKTGQVTPHPIQAESAGRWNNQHSIYEDQRGILWLGTFGGLARYDPDTHHFALYRSPKPDIPIKTVFEDRQHRFWVATLRGLYLFDRLTRKFTLMSAPAENGLQPTFISFYLDDKNTLWLGTAGHGLFQIDLRHEPFQLVSYNPGGQINPYVYLNSIHRDTAGAVWVGTTNGLQRIDPVNHTVFTYHPDPANRTGISSNNAQAVYHDRAGIMWVGTDNGIDRENAPSKPFLSYQVIPNTSTVNLSANKARSLLVDSLNRLWFTNERTVYRVDLQTNRLKNLPPEPDQTRNYIHTLFPSGPEGMWVGTWNNLYYLDYKTNRYLKFPSDSVHVEFISQRKGGPVWIAGDGGIASFDSRTHRYRYYTYKPGSKNGLLDKYIAGLVVSQTGDIWVLVSRYGVCRLNPKTGQFTQYVAGGAGRLNSNEVRAIYEDDKGIIWVGTHQGGLNWFDPRTEQFSAITTRDGLPGNSITSITSDNAGHIWFSTNKGICRFDPQTKTVLTYDVGDGLPSSTFLENAAFRRNNHVFFGSLNGVVYFNPNQICSNKRPFPVYITGLKVMEKPRPPTDSTLVLKYNENFLSFEFAALTYVLPEQNQYAHQLVGVDEQWVTNVNERYATYPNLAPGEYTFRVKAANSDGIWNRKEAAIHFIVQPPWWATWWAYGLYAVFLVSGLTGYIRFYTNRIRQKQEMELSQRDARQLKVLDEMKSRFFSNITHEFRTPLSLIIGPVESLLKEDKFDQTTRQKLGLVQGNADKLLHLISQLLDLSKLEAGGMTISLMRGNATEFVEQLVNSFRQMAEQKGVQLSYTANESIPEGLFDADKWGKVLSNLLSNAIKFTGPDGQVSVTLGLADGDKKEGRSLVHITVADTGIGIPPEKLPHIFDRFYQVDDSRTRAYEGTGIGLALVKELVEIVQGNVAVESKPNEGTRFTLLLPIAPIPETSDTALPLPVPMPGIKPDNYGFSNEETAVLPHKIPVGESSKPLILFVEDNNELRQFVASELAESYQVLSAVDGEEGWRLIQEELPDIVISDLMMPKMDGYELTGRIKTNPLTSHIAVILLTAKTAQDNKMAALEKGADEYLTKPFQMGEIRLRIRNLLDHQQKLRQRYSQQLSNPDEPLSSEMVHDPFLQEFHALLDENLSNTSLNVDWLADQLSMSRKTLQRKVSSLTQMESPSELIRHYRLRRATELLLAGKNVTETAELVGFKAATHFTKSFKDFYHQTPTQFVEKRKVSGSTPV
ncbi:hybrid sensor histidine kinase/response regulator transcription factor [Spirosoma luteum]|uniref:hybrid sensor histidine kinase/response regulator transcription factor n=1 Tax=Spirosoma luteum TaxID=431553 RepID=UPI00036F252F|nr:two-component regulator propeller domain-containing protein [Spirosoma luteum]